MSLNHINIFESKVVIYKAHFRFLQNKLRELRFATEPPFSFALCDDFIEMLAAMGFLVVFDDFGNILSLQWLGIPPDGRQPAAEDDMFTWLDAYRQVFEHLAPSILPDGYIHWYRIIEKKHVAYAGEKLWEFDGCAMSERPL